MIDIRSRDEFDDASVSTESREITERCLASLEKFDIHRRSSIQKLLSWMLKGRNGEPLTIVSTACPAYDYETPPGRPPRYTYSGLGSDIGLAGKRFFRSLDGFHSILRVGLSIASFRHEVLVADFESFNGFTLQRVGVTAEDFLQRARSTARAYEDEGRGRIVATTFSSVCGGKKEWDRELSQLNYREAEGEFADLMSRSMIRKIGEEQRATFEQFLRESVHDERLLDRLVVMRAFQLAAAGYLISRRYKNPLILSISDGSVSRFFGLTADVPVLDMSGME